MNVPTICERESLTSAITYKMARKLEKAGLIKSYRGSAGGYALNCDLERTSLYDILTVIDSKMLLIECMQSGYDCLVNQPKQPCMAHREFLRIQLNLNKELKECSLAKLLHG
jgi:Rrf2 family protein